MTIIEMGKKKRLLCLMSKIELNFNYASNYAEIYKKWYYELIEN